MIELLTRARPTILMEAHNGLTARLVAEAGFEGIWASGLSISASLGLRDANEISWSQLVDLVGIMCDATDVPVLVDGDEGFGNFNSARRLSRKLEQAGAGGVCFEDKSFPKSNSFADAVHVLAPIPEFCGKIAATVDTRRDARFAIVARTEALIAGRSVDEALERAAAYVEAGADSVLVHSKRSDAADVLAFLDRWPRDTVPITLVPTKYPSVGLPTLTARGASNFVFANQGLRTIVSALRRTLLRLRETEDLLSVESEIASVDDVFVLQDTAELEQAERRYLRAH